MTAHNPPVSVRISASERTMLEVAARQARTNLGDFMRRKAIEAAEVELLDRRVVTIPARSGRSSRPGAMPPLRKLAATRPAWQD